MTELNISAHRDVCRLIDAAIGVAALGGMYQPADLKAASEYVRHQAGCVIDEHERTVLNAMADYFDVQSRMDANGDIAA